jgi:hypothetical protein
MKIIQRMSLILVLVIMLICCGTSKQEQSSDLHLNERYQTIKDFYQFYDKKEYEKMNQYLSEDMINSFSEGVEAIPRAKLISINENQSKEWDGKYWINVDLEIETTKSSSIYPEKECNLYILVSEVNNKWIIVDTTTG